ncbi:hypothetical protein L1887_35484 [Cichorium endivia]|nr:hypothetical protein L1887_35484 [Cichorium endivia]
MKLFPLSNPLLPLNLSPASYPHPLQNLSLYSLLLQITSSLLQVLWELIHLFPPYPTPPSSPNHEKNIDGGSGNPVTSSSQPPPTLRKKLLYFMLNHFGIQEPITIKDVCDVVQTAHNFMNEHVEKIVGAS